MGCCGEKRSALERSTPTGAVADRMSTPGAPLPNKPPVGAVSRAADAVVLEYVERSRIRVRGPVTGALYAFSGAEPVQRVDRRDAPALLGTQHFKRRP